MATTLAEGAKIINESLATLGYEYRIDTTSNETITAGLQVIGAYAPSQRNTIMEQMNLVIQQRNFGVIFDATKNKFRAFLVDMTPEGFGIEDIFHELLDGKATLWDGNATSEEIYKDLVGYKDSDIQKFFHTESASRKFDCTIDRRNYDKVFTAVGVTRYIDTKIANLSWSAEKWLMNQVVAIVKEMIAGGKMKFLAGHNINTKDGLNSVVEDIKSLTSGFLTPTDIYNLGKPTYSAVTGLTTYTPVINMTDSENDIFIVTTPEYMARLKVQGYSNAFNLSQYELEGRIIYAPAGTDFGKYNSESVYAVVLDRRSILVGLKYWLASSFFVPNTYWVNHFLNVEILKGYNTIFNCVAITGEAIDNFFSEVKNSYLSVFKDSNLAVVTDGELLATEEANDYYDNMTYIRVTNKSNTQNMIAQIKYNNYVIDFAVAGETKELRNLVNGGFYEIQMISTGV